MTSGCESLMRESGAALEWVFGGEGDGGSRSPVPHPAGSGPSAAPGSGASVPGCRAKAPHSFRAEQRLDPQTVVTLRSLRAWWWSPGIAGSVGCGGSRVPELQPGLGGILRFLVIFWHPLEKWRCKGPCDLGP